METEDRRKETEGKRRVAQSFQDLIVWQKAHAFVLGGDGDPGALRIDNPPAAILMAGLQGSGKTTTTAKLAKRLRDRDGKRVLMA